MTNSSEKHQAGNSSYVAEAKVAGLPQVFHRQRGWRERSLWRYLMAAAVLVVLHIPLKFMDFDTEVETVAEQDDFPEVVTLPPVPPNADETGLAVADIYGWARLADPSQWLRPDERDGFSAANRPLARPEPPPLPEYALQRYSLGKFIFVEKPLSVPPLAVAAQIPSLWRSYAGDNPLKTVALASLPAPARQIVWRRGDGLALANPPSLDAEGQRIWQSEETRQALETADGYTWIDVIFGEPPTAIAGDADAEADGAREARAPLPRIVLRQSCGVKALDDAACRALRRHLRRVYAGPLLPFPGTEAISITW